MEIKIVSIKDIKPYDKNPRNNDKAVEKVAASIKEFGFKQPLVVDKNGVLIVGHTRLKAAVKLGITQVPVLYAEDLTNQQVKAYRLADNKTAEFAEWDFDLLNSELNDLLNANIDMRGFGFDVDELIKQEVEDDDFNFDAAVDEISEPNTKKGNIYLLGNHRLMCGDSTNIKDFENLMAGNKAKLIVTDPPYNVNYEGQNGMKIKNDSMSNDAFYKFLYDAYKVMFEFAETGCPIYVFHADTEGLNFRKAFKDVGFKLSECLIWVKNSLVLGRQDYHWRHEPILYGWKEGSAHYWYGARNKDTIIENYMPFEKMKKEDLIDLLTTIYNQSSIIYESKPLSNDIHPTMKPLPLIAKLIENSSQISDLVVDPFGGSGSTLMACEQLNRTCYTMEFDEKYCDAIIKRFEDFTGKQAKLLES